MQFYSSSSKTLWTWFALEGFFWLVGWRRHTFFQINVNFELFPRICFTKRINMSHSARKWTHPSRNFILLSRISIKIPHKFLKCQVFLLPSDSPSLTKLFTYLRQCNLYQLEIGRGYWTDSKLSTIQGIFTFYILWIERCGLAAMEFHSLLSRLCLNT